MFFNFFLFINLKFGMLSIENQNQNKVDGILTALDNIEIYHQICKNKEDYQIQHEKILNDNSIDCFLSFDNYEKISKIENKLTVSFVSNKNELLEKENILLFNPLFEEELNILNQNCTKISSDFFILSENDQNFNKIESEHKLNYSNLNFTDIISKIIFYEMDVFLILGNDINIVSRIIEDLNWFFPKRHFFVNYETNFYSKNIFRIKPLIKKYENLNFELTIKYINTIKSKKKTPNYEGFESFFKTCAIIELLNDLNNYLFIEEIQLPNILLKKQKNLIFLEDPN